MHYSPIPPERPLYWVASAKQDLLEMPRPVIREIGIVLGVAQRGGKHPFAKPWKGEGPGVFEIVNRYDGDAFRAVYVTSFRKAIYVLHCFQKKSPRGRRTAQTDVDLIRDRLKAARSDYGIRHGEKPH